MNKKLAGITFCWEGIKQDYCFIETIKCLTEFCDTVVVLAGGDDGTYEEVFKHFLYNDKVLLRPITQQMWHAAQGREKLALFQNIAKEEANNCEWQFVLQADEAVAPSSYDAIHKAIQTDAEGFYVTRVNFWGDCYHKLNVPENRSPVGTRIIRLARTFYPSIGDGESILAAASEEYMHEIKILHYGFIRNSKKHLVKIRHIQDDVFQIPHDTRIDGMEEFDASKMGFTRDDLEYTNEAMIPLMREWCQARYNHEKSVQTWK